MFYTEHHSLSTTRNFGQRHRLNALLYNYAATQFRPHYGCLLSTDRHHPVPTRSRSQRFLTEFHHLVECVGTKSGIIILGDFNVPYGDVDDAHARALRDILPDANLRQNVTDATHNRGNILDLIITSTSSSPITRYLLTILLRITTQLCVTSSQQSHAHPTKR